MSLLRDPVHGHLVGIEQKPHAAIVPESVRADQELRDEVLAEEHRRRRFDVLRSRFDHIVYGDLTDEFLDEVERLLGPIVHIGEDYPKWVRPHESYVTKSDDGRVLVADYPDAHIDRAGNATVLVNNEDDEHRAMGARQNPEPTIDNRFSPHSDASDPNIPKNPNPKSLTDRNVGIGDPNLPPPVEPVKESATVEDAHYRGNGDA